MASALVTSRRPVASALAVDQAERKMSALNHRHCGRRVNVERGRLPLGARRPWLSSAVARRHLIFASLAQRRSHAREAAAGVLHRVSLSQHHQAVLAGSGD